MDTMTGIYITVRDLACVFVSIVSASLDRIMDLLRSPVFVTKGTEIVSTSMGITSIAFIVASLEPSAYIFYSEVVYASFYGYLLLNLVVLLGFLMQEPVSQKLSLIISLSGAVLHLLSFLILVEAWDMFSQKRHLASAVFSLFNFFAFVFDFVFFWKYGSHLPPRKPSFLDTWRKPPYFLSTGYI
ncbi:hypothetical protein M8J76_015733 [Diaphorina citri]|nr:hypothetical protein M8J76_015733 [Diaphorina citri]